MKDIRYRVLFLASWYPSRINKVLGMFVKRKAETMTKKCDVSLIYVTMDNTLKDRIYDMETNTENNVFTVRVYFAAQPSGIINKILYNIRYLKSWYYGLKTVRREWGAFDLVHVNVIDRAGYIALLLKWFKGIKYVITEHSTPDVKFLKGETTSTHIPLFFLKKLAVKNAEFINVDSHPSMEYWNKAGLFGNYGVIANVVEVHPFFLDMQKKNDGIKRAVHISALMERKNVGDIIKAYAHIYHQLQRKNIEFHIIGEGEQKEKLILLSAELDVLNKCVFFHGFVDEEKKLEMIVNSDFHILNSDEEGFSVVTAEAILYGIPVIATKCGGPEDFVPKEVGILINRRNINELTDAILYMLDNSDKYDKKVLQEFGKSRFSPDVICEKTYAAYKKAAVSWKAGNTHSRIEIAPVWNVLDVGSGHQPNRRANYLLERYMDDTQHRTIQKVEIPSDKNLIIADAHSAPFKDKSFDYVIASHIAEHIDNPVKFGNELQRISKSGYIETPGPLTELLLPDEAHKWVVKRDGNILRFKNNPHKKPAWEFFYRLFYLNRDGYRGNILHSSNSILRAINWILVKTWKYIPGTYTILKWNDKFMVKVD